MRFQVPCVPDSCSEPRFCRAGNSSGTSVGYLKCSRTAWPELDRKTLVCAFLRRHTQPWRPCKRQWSRHVSNYRYQSTSSPPPRQPACTAYLCHLYPPLRLCPAGFSGSMGGAAITPAEATRPGGARPFAAPHLEAHTAAIVCAALRARPIQAPPLSLLAGAASQAHLLVSWHQIEAPSSSGRSEFGTSKP